MMAVSRKAPTRLVLSLLRLNLIRFDQLEGGYAVEVLENMPSCYPQILASSKKRYLSSFVSL
jgi:hypothetical protein